MHKPFLILCLFAATLPAAALAQSYTAVLSGAAEVPGPGDPDGAGLAVITIDGTTIRYSVLVQNIQAPTQAHIHRGAAGVEGPVVVGLDVNTLASGTLAATQSVVAEITANPSGFYVNVHNGEFPAGAIRGQLVAPTAAGARELYLSVVGKVAGAAGENFVTAVRIINHGTATATVTLDYFQQSTAGHAAPTASITLTVAPGEQKVVDDVIGALGSSSLGGLRVTSTENVEVLARVLNDLRSGGQGTTGFAVHAGELTGATTSGTLGFLSASSVADMGAGIGFRTNIGYFNPSASTVTATFTARRTENGAALGTKTITIPGYGFVQQGAFALIDTVEPAGQVQENFYVTWSADASLFVYAAVVDNKTGDSVLVQ
ncbi:MAG TPA: CHRD domain-containing protein [Thermoanaerobaculia bacterium]|nr:CHRD domain-containing protein [Thermoanaerobaculia bacterium]